MKLAEGSEIKVNCAWCGKYQWVITIMKGDQQVRCPECARDTYIGFQQNRDESFMLKTSRYNDIRW
jgi:endogenous inhibitor of DNA gyrase (YacG/DUF329 family)